MSVSRFPGANHAIQLINYGGKLTVNHAVPILHGIYANLMRIIMQNESVYLGKNEDVPANASGALVVAGCVAS